MQISKMTTPSESGLQAISFHGSALFVASVSMAALLLTPVAMLAGVLVAWRLSAALGWTSDFFIAEGLLSHYQLWLAIAIGAQTSAFIFNRWVANQNRDLPALAQ